MSVLSSTQSKTMSMAELRQWFGVILGPERSYFWLAIIYGVAISLLSLALPISVQMLIDTVANTALVQQLVVLVLALFVLLAISGGLIAMREHVMERFGRRIYARLVAQFSLRAVYAQPYFFEEAKRDDLFDRYFDIMTLQTYIPSILSGGFTIVLQAILGFVVVSLYHPMLLAFNLIIVGLLIIIWVIWGRRAIQAGFERSHAKYDTARWLEGLAESNGFYKSDRHVSFALNRSDAMTEKYINKDIKLFRFTFSQILSLLAIYALASACLLGLGGWLVIQGQLTLGQLVAAELIMSAIFIGFSQFGEYLKQFYDVCAATEEIAVIYNIPLEGARGDGDLAAQSAEIQFHNVEHLVRGRPVKLDVRIPAGAKVLVRVEYSGLQRLITDLLRRHTTPSKGWTRVAEQDVLDYDPYSLRHDVAVIDRGSMVECTLEQFLKLANPTADRATMMNVLKHVQLQDVVTSLDGGLDARITPNGWPLETSEVLRLKLAAALISDAPVIVLGAEFELVPEKERRAILRYLDDQCPATVLFFTSHDEEEFGHTLTLGETKQTYAPPRDTKAEASS